MSRAWLRCNIGKGMFSDEFAVTYKDNSFFVPKNAVREDRVLVQFFKQGDVLWAIAPTDNQLTIAVDAKDIETVAEELGLIPA